MLKYFYYYNDRHTLPYIHHLYYHYYYMQKMDIIKQLVLLMGTFSYERKRTLSNNKMRHKYILIIWVKVISIE